MRRLYERSIQATTGNSTLRAARSGAVGGESTIRRCQAVTRGRLAEERLAREGDTLSREERRELAADGLLGRLSMQTELPKGLGRAWLMKQDAFCRAADGPVEGILTGLRQGTLLRQIAARGERRAAPRQPERTKDGPGMKK